MISIINVSVWGDLSCVFLKWRNQILSWTCRLAVCCISKGELREKNKLGDSWA